MMNIDFTHSFALPPFWKKNGGKVINYFHDLKDFNETNDLNNVKDFYDISDFDDIREQYTGNRHQAPLSFKFEEETDFWRLPLDPVIAVNGKNNVIRRSVLMQPIDKVRRGTVKELWSQDDYEIAISGVLRTGDAGDEILISKLRSYCEQPKIIQVSSPFLQSFGIEQIVIESYDFPHSKGMDNQLYTIKAYSDDVFDLIIE